MRGKYLLIIVGGASWMSACASQAPPKIAEIRNYNATFLCDGTKVVKVSFTPFAAVLKSEGVSTALAQQPATGEFLYTGGSQSLRARGPEAVWTDGKGAVHQCQERPAQALR